MATQRIETGGPLGRLTVEWRAGRLWSVRAGQRAEPADRCPEEAVWAAVRGLEAASLAERGTPFQREVWRAARQIPAGQTREYGEIARSLGRPGASRAVGAALGANPFLIAVPCHRVVAAGGALTGFAAGLEAKRWLLEREAATTGRVSTLFSDDR